MKRSTALRRALVVTCTLSASPAMADPPNPPRCPATAPSEGSSCATPQLECGYVPCGEYNTLRATCDPRTSRWALVRLTCNPPPPPPVPPSRNPPARQR